MKVMTFMRLLSRILPSPYSGITKKSLESQDATRNQRVSKRVATELGRGSIYLATGNVVTEDDIKARYKNL